MEKAKQDSVFADGRIVVSEASKQATEDHSVHFGGVGGVCSKRRAVSGEIFPGRRCSDEKMFAMLASSPRSFLGIPYHNEMRRSSLQSIVIRPPTPERSASGASSRFELLTAASLQCGSVPRLLISPSSSVEHSATNSPSLSCKSNGRAEVRELSEGLAGRRLSCVSGSLITSHVVSRYKEPRIYNIGVDYMKVSKTLVMFNYWLLPFIKRL